MESYVRFWKKVCRDRVRARMHKAEKQSTQRRLLSSIPDIEYDEVDKIVVLEHRGAIEPYHSVEEIRETAAEIELKRKKDSEPANPERYQRKYSEAQRERKAANYAKNRTERGLSHFVAPVPEWKKQRAEPKEWWKSRDGTWHCRPSGSSDDRAWTVFRE